MYCKQCFALILNDIIKKETICGSYSIADELAKNLYGKDAFAVESTYFAVGEGDKYINGQFYTKDGKLAEYYGTQEENINKLKDEAAKQNQDIIDLADMIIELTE